ncbi:MAG TPA: hypothetical protein VEJ36_01500, partial [Nitrososphaerales archaeon]|nr:hypothetical protein [Nitrososphaerales archaeon]
MSSDKYAWLENLEDPKVIGWASKQDSISRRSLKASSERLYRRLVRLFDETVVELALVTKEGLVLWMSDSRTNTVELRKDDGGKKTLLNSKQLGDNATVIRVYARPEGGVVAVTYSLGGSDEGTTAFIDTRTSKILDRIEGVIWGIVWLNEKSFYYVRMHAKEKSEDGVDPPTARVYLRSAGKDKLVFGQGLGTDYFVDVRPSSDGNKALLDVSFGWTRSRPYAGDLKHPEAWSPIYPDRDAVVTLVDHSAGRYLLLSFEKSRGQVLSTDGQIVRRVIDEAEWPLDSVSLVGDKLLCHYLVDACSELRLFDQTGRRELTLK